MNTAPILPGFYPDPSICRAGDRYYLATSTCQYLPGIPIHVSTDLEHWNLIGHAFSRREQVDLSDAPSSAGLYAPTIRHHDGVFYLVTTDIGTVHQGHLIVQTTDPAGEWSLPVRTPGAIGIDPDLFWDEDGTCYLAWKGLAAPGEPVISFAPIDPATGELQGAVRELWQGSGSQASPESPHVFHRGDYYYTILAEGGTERTHSATIARARSLDGPWEPHPANPFFTHRGTTSPVQNAGHADLVENADGSWNAVYLAVRPRGFTPRFHVNGRETFLADVTWAEDWPVFTERYPDQKTETAFIEDFSEPGFDGRWISHGGSHWQHTEHLDAGLLVSRVAGAAERPAIAVRARDESWIAEVAVDGPAALQIHMDTDNWAELCREGDLVTVRILTLGIPHQLAERTVEGVRTLIASAVPWPSDGRFNQGPDQIVFSVRTDAGAEEVMRFDGRLLSTEVTAGFTGRTIGVRALEAPVLLRRFSYQPSGLEAAAPIPV